MIGIRGINIKSLSLEKENDAMKIVGKYALMSTTDKVLATQSVNGYGDLEVRPSADTVKAMDAFIKAFKRDIESVIGLESEGAA